MKIIKILSIFFTIVFATSSCQKEDVLNQVPVADAGSPRVIQLPKDTVRLNGKGQDADGKIVGYLWSMIEGPNAPLINKNGSDSATVIGLVSGVYLFQFMVIDELGATGVDTVSVTVLPSQTINLTLRPVQNPNEMYLAGNSIRDEGSGQIDEIGVAAWTNAGTEYSIRTLLKFDLSGVPANATIISAKLSLYSHPNPVNGNHSTPNFGTNNSMLIQRTTNSWVASTTKWSNKPGFTSDYQVIIPTTILGSMDLLDLDVKDLVGSMLGANNFGFHIKLQTEAVYNSRMFCSSRYTDAAKHPKLELVYKIN